MENQNFKTKWNWGAFMNPIGFGVGNRAYLCLLVLVPILNVIWIFVSGAKAEAWTLNNPGNHYRDEEEFRNVMDSWKRGGFVQFLISIASLLLYILLIFGFGISLTN